MSRDLVSDDRPLAGDTFPLPAARRGLSTPPDRSAIRNRPREIPSPSETIDGRNQDGGRDQRSDRLRAYYVRERTYLLRDSELQSLTEVGKFRLIAASDLQTYAYREDPQEMERDIGRLVRQDLLTDQTLPISHKKILRVVTLTKGGHRLLKHARNLPNDQAIYHGLRKPREARHDADLYRVYQKETARIERSGGSPRRILLDYELKKHLNRDLAFLPREGEYLDRKREIAQKHGFQVVDGKIPIPDLRLEYQTTDFEIRHVDLELATREYKPQVLVEKAAAGFSLYSRSEDAPRLRRILDEREVSAEIFAL
jgi:hypothetical protein